MSRGLTASMLTEIAGSSLRPVLLAYMDFAGGAVRLWNGYRDLVYDGNTFSPSGTFGAVSNVDEAVDLAAKGVSLTLSGIPSDVLALALTDNYQGRAIRIWLGVMDTSGALVADPTLIFGGRMDTMALADSGELGAITITCESHLIDLNRSRERRYTLEDQKIDFPSDLGFEFVAGLQDKQIMWGAGPASTPGGGGSGGGGAPVGDEL